MSPHGCMSRNTLSPKKTDRRHARVSTAIRPHYVTRGTGEGRVGDETRRMTRATRLQDRSLREVRAVYSGVRAAGVAKRWWVKAMKACGIQGHECLQSPPDRGQALVETLHFLNSRKSKRSLCTNYFYKFLGCNLNEM
ncbi:hypothetical protein Zmor_000588 [Zophobas morio]|uniref:Uncharacterized protein n=1 Tax=Zophobas morio TaxID=2755281 RepID=A0AA38MNN9_9CUCU|nr:hypothetical protein Zmor_000588 [Zophobas morio]